MSKTRKKHSAQFKAKVSLAALANGIKLRRYRRSWEVERTFAWVGNFRRLVVRWDRLITAYISFSICLA